MSRSMYELIQKQKRGEALSDADIAYIVDGVTEGSIPDYQTSAWLMAVCLRGMSKAETLALTLAMARSGTQNDLSALPGVKVDKHSTGGVGDKTTLIVAPLAAACGLTVAKMSGRGLGHTGGTIDKLEAVPGFRTELSNEAFRRAVEQCGVCVAGQSGDLAPADKKLYALRDVTATVDSIPLIAASVMSKKLASGADCILLDVKAGGGAFMKTPEEAAALARVMTDIGNGAGRQTAALISDMNRPLGFAVGNALELWEAWTLLDSGGKEADADLRTLCVRIVTELLLLAHKRRPALFPSTRDACKALVLDKMGDGSAAMTFKRWLRAQGGDTDVLTRGFPAPAVTGEWRAEQSGYIHAIDAEVIGLASLRLGAGRRVKTDSIDPLAGLLFRKKTGDYVCKGDVLASLYAADEDRCADAASMLAAQLTLRPEKPPEFPLIYGFEE